MYNDNGGLWFIILLYRETGGTILPSTIKTTAD